jgi:hypothetical protein
MSPIALLPMIFLLSACVPAPFGAYYKPDYASDSATLIKEYCQGEAGPPSVLTFKATHGVAITVTTAKSYMDSAREDTPLTITVNVPKNTAIQFASDNLRISETLNGEGYKALTTLKVAALVPMGKDDVVDLDSAGPVSSMVAKKAISSQSAASVSKAHIDIEFPDKQFHPDVAVLHLPAVNIKGETITFPAPSLIANTQDKGWWRYESKEHQQAREVQYSRCVADTPQLHCKNILQIIDTSYRLTNSGFDISGNLFMAGFTQNPTLTGRLDFSNSTTDPWHFTTNDIYVEDIKTGDVRHFYFDKFSVFFGWFDVPLTTEVKGAKADATIRIETTLGKRMRPKYYIKLPPMLINGQEYVFKPIELDLKMFDGGVQPFNC